MQPVHFHTRTGVSRESDTSGELFQRTFIEIEMNGKIMRMLGVGIDGGKCRREITRVLQTPLQFVELFLRKPLAGLNGIQSLDELRRIALQSRDLQIAK